MIYSYLVILLTSRVIDMVVIKKSITLSLMMASFLFFAGNCLASDTFNTRGTYFGVFGGTGSSMGSSVQQVGTVITSSPRVPDINVNANGFNGSARASVAGLKLGYEWSGWSSMNSKWILRPAAELEGIYLNSTSDSVLDITPYALGTQYVSLPLSAKIVLANAVLSIKTPFSDIFIPYIGGGVGGAWLFVRGSNSTNPSEPGINHFNSNPDASSSALAMQAKAGIRGQINRNLAIFMEYRYLSIQSSSYTFGATSYPGVHLPTTNWNVNVGRQAYNLVAAGIEYRFD
jgi:opacity protein-like surface antigen